MIIKLTTEFGGEVYVSTDHITHFYLDRNNLGPNNSLTNVWLLGDKSALTVRQTPEEILKMMIGASVGQQPVP